MSTMKDIAALAGVSTATVSRALMQPEQVKEKTRAKVQEAIDQLGYTPNLMARSLRRQKSDALLILVPDISNPFFSVVIRGIERIAHQHGYSVLLGDTQNQVEREQAYANLLRTKQADGVILLGDRIPDDLDPALSSQPIDAPFVMTCATAHKDYIHNIYIDNVAAAKAMTQHLIDCGHQNIGCVLGYDNRVTDDRFFGFQQALSEAGLPLKPEWVKKGDYTSESGLKAGQQFLSGDRLPDAIFCFNDEMAFGLMGAMRDRGLQIPNDLAVAGFDDISMSTYSNPPLTTVSQDPIKMGEAAATMLLQLLNNEKPDKKQREIEFNLKIRASTQALSR